MYARARCLTYEKQWNIYVLHCLPPISALQENDHDKDDFIRAYVSSYEFADRSMRTITPQSIRINIYNAEFETNNYVLRFIIIFRINHPNFVLEELLC